MLATVLNHKIGYEKAAMVGMGVATGGAGLAGAGIAGGTGDLGGPGLGGAGLISGSGEVGNGLSGGDGLTQAAGRYQQAQGWTARARGLNAVGLRSAGQYAQSLSQEHQIAGRQAELSDRMQRLADPDDVFDELDAGRPAAGSSPSAEVSPLVPGMRLPGSVSQRVMSNFTGSRNEFGPAYQGFSQAVQEKEGSRFRLDAILAAHPEETARMVSAYYANPDTITGADQPLRQAAINSGASQVLFEAYGEQLPNPNDISTQK